MDVRLRPETPGSERPPDEGRVAAGRGFADPETCPVRTQRVVAVRDSRVRGGQPVPQTCCFRPTKTLDKLRFLLLVRAVPQTVGCGTGHGLLPVL